MQVSSLPTGLYNPKTFFTHTALLRQSFLHCAIFPTAASRRSLDRVSVPVWPIILSDRLPIFGLVRHYRPNYLMGREPLPRWIAPFLCKAYAPQNYPVLAPLSERYPKPEDRLLTCSSPVRR